MDADTETVLPHPLTLAIDIGGSHLKAGILSSTGTMVSGPARADTPRPSSPSAILEILQKITDPLGSFDRISVGFPGVVRHGAVYTAPNLGTPSWQGFPLAAALEQRFGKPTRVLNDASVQGLGVISGRGLEVVITLGTGMGFALFEDGRLMPHLELSQIPVRKGTTYDQYVGIAALQAIGRKRWNKRVAKVIGYIDTLTAFDTLHIGGGNAKQLHLDLPERVQVVSNTAGITGGVKLWDSLLDEAFGAASHALRGAMIHA
jgi:polyphosphate glucokinase